MPTVAMAMHAREKLRSLNSDSGTSAVAPTRACQATKSANSTSPAMSSTQKRQSQPKLSPSWMAKMRQNIPTALSRTPSTSKRLLVTSRRGTKIHARMMPMMPTGTLTKKIHSQPAASTSKPPSSGPTMVATPATPPHTPIAAPRCVGEKMRIITDMVCGVSSAPPNPWKTRATMSISMLPARPHHRDDSVNSRSPSR